MFSFWKVKPFLSGRTTDLEGRGSENDWKGGGGSLGSSDIFSYLPQRSETGLDDFSLAQVFFFFFFSLQTLNFLFCIGVELFNSAVAVYGEH